MSRPKDEWPWPVGDAGGRALPVRRAGFEQAAVGGGRGEVAQHPAEPAAKHVGGFAGGKAHRFEGPKMEAKAVKLEGRHRARGRPAESNVRFRTSGSPLYNGRAF